MRLDPEAIRGEFPLLGREIAGQRLLYLDCASTAPRMRRVLDAIRGYHEQTTGNVHRGVHLLATEASAAYEAARHVVARHLGATPGEIVLTSGTTHGINLAAASLALEPEDEVVVTRAEHHANSLPFRARCRLVTLPSRPDGVPRWDALASCVSARTRLIAVHHVSNVLGTIAPLAEVGRVAREHGVPWLVDGAQAAGHLPIDVKALGCTFYAFSAHKLGGPAGTGALFVEGRRLAGMAPHAWGGGMVARVETERLELRDGPARHEAGTPNVEGVLGMAAAIEGLHEIGMAEIAAHGASLARALVAGVGALPGVRVLGLGEPFAPRIPLVSLALSDAGLDAEDVARTLCDTFGILVSAGRHCAHVLHDALGARSTLRAAAWMIHDEDDVGRFVGALRGLVG